jgi:hypothetical protein
MDGDIDYSRYSRAQLEEALTRIDRSKYPVNYENLRRELDARAPEPQRETRPPSTAFLIVCYTMAVLVLNAVVRLFFDAALVLIFHDPSEARGVAGPWKLGIFFALLVGACFHLARTYRSQFANVMVGVALVLGGFNVLAARLPPFRSTLNPIAAILQVLVLTLLAAVAGRVLAAVFGSRGAPSNNRWRGP